MNIQSQVCTLQQSIRLKELGVLQESLFCFVGDETLPHELYLTREAYSEVGSYWYKNRIAAYTVAELGVMLPGNDMQKGEFMNFSKGAKNGCWSVDYNGIDAPGLPDPYLNPDKIETEAEVRAAMLIYLLENNLITAEEINSRLLNS